MQLESGPIEGPDDEAIEVFRGTDYCLLREYEAGVLAPDVRSDNGHRHYHDQCL
jgi:hypothetical protein